MRVSVLTLSSAACLLLGCSQGPKDSFETPISGYYKIVSMESAVEVDMNNDGIRSSDVYAEISGLQHVLDNVPLSFYDFEAQGNYMEVRPLDYQTNSAKIISLNIPDQRIDVLTTGQYFLTDYFHTFLNYRYALSDQSNKIEIVSGNPDYEENGILNNFELQSSGSLKLEMTKELFDFVDSKWIQ